MFKPYISSKTITLIFYSIDLWLKRISDLIKTLKTIKTLLKVSQIFELRSIVLLQCLQLWQNIVFGVTPFKVGQHCKRTK